MATAAPESDHFLDGYAPWPCSRENPCRGLDFASRGGFSIAVRYWMHEGMPERMDADGDGIPCETVFDQISIDRGSSSIESGEWASCSDSEGCCLVKG